MQAIPRLVIRLNWFEWADAFGTAESEFYSGLHKEDYSSESGFNIYYSRFI